MGGFPLSRNFYVRVHVRKFYSRKSNSGEMKSVELKREVERGSTLTFTCNLSSIASILFTKVRFTHVRA